MATGFKTYSGTGATEIDTTLVTWNLVDFFEVAANTTVTKTYASLAGLEFLLVQIPLEVPKVDDYTYEKTLSFTTPNNIPTVKVSGGSQKGMILVNAR